MHDPQLLNTLFQKYKLHYDPTNPNSKANDVFKHKHYTIITRQGIQKIEKEAGVVCDIQVVDSISTPTNVTMRGTGSVTGENGIIRNYTTFASASAETSNNQYYAEMAEKRCRSRLVLTLVGLYELGVYGEDEADTFAETVKKMKETAPNRPTTGTVSGVRAVYKGNQSDFSDPS